MCFDIFMTVKTVDLYWNELWDVQQYRFTAIPNKFRNLAFCFHCKSPTNLQTKNSSLKKKKKAICIIFAATCHAIHRINILHKREMKCHNSTSWSCRWWCSEQEESLVAVSLEAKLKKPVADCYWQPHDCHDILTAQLQMRIKFLL